MTVHFDDKGDASSPSWRPIAIAGYLVIASIFGVGGIWVTFAHADKAVVAGGTVGTETNRKTIQHYEGGIVRDILVKEGAMVTEGQVLFRFETVQSQAMRDQLKSQLDAALVVEARLLSERSNLTYIEWPEEVATRSGDVGLAGLMKDQIQQFQERRVSLEGQIQILKSRIGQLQNEMEGIAIERDSSEKQVVYIKQELEALVELASKKLVQASRVFAMERERTRLEGLIYRSQAETEKTQGAVREAELQIVQASQKVQEDVSNGLVEMRQKISDLRQRLGVAQDVLHRAEIKSPRDGFAQNLKVFTIGQVIRSGEALVDIAPLGEKLVINAQFSANDIDVVHAGMSAEIRFPAFHSRNIPVLLGKLDTLSQDRLIDEGSRQAYYLGIISLERADIPEDLRSRVRPGMPAEVVVSAGERSVLSYLISPLRETLRKTFSEQ